MNPEQRARALFVRSFGSEPAAVASAPGRVNLIGEHVDYHGGHVLPFATEERTAVALGPAPGQLRLVSEQSPPVEGAWPPRPRHDWSDYVAGVIGDEGTGFAAAVDSDVPLGGGLSSSAALEVAAAIAHDAWRGRASSPREVAERAWRAETQFVGVPCGRMDQLASVLPPAGSAILLDCRTLEIQPVPVALDVVIVDSGESHHLAQSAYAERRREGDAAIAALRAEFPALKDLVDLPVARLPAVARGLPAPLDRRVRHVVNENQRTLLAARALDAGDLTTFGALVNASHDSLRDLYECSTPRLDEIVDAARKLVGVLGARLVGAGWGGSVLVACQPGTGEEIATRFPDSRVIRPGSGALPEVA